MNKEDIIDKIKEFRTKLFILSDIIGMGSAELEYASKYCTESKMFLGRCLSQLLENNAYTESTNFENDIVGEIGFYSVDDFKLLFDEHKVSFEYFKSIKRIKFIRHHLSLVESDLKTIFNDSIELKLDSNSWYIMALMQAINTCISSSLWMHQEMGRIKIIKEN